jgi:hypothetical protein
MKRVLHPVATAALALPAVLVCVLIARGQGDQPRQAAAEPARSGPTRLYFGIDACIQCHTRPGEREPVLCRCTEAAIWDAEDKHHDAFQVLHSDRAQQIGTLLRFQHPVWEDKRCVSCHGVWIEDAKRRHRTFKAEDGVSCVACHGAFRDWVALHGDVLERDTWRGYSRQFKEEKYGMKDLWDPAKRARLCASCHVGNHAQGKVVTHAMYAAGHPPLPGVEIATFSDAMPRHWQYAREKRPEIRKILRFRPDEAAFEQTRLLAVGSAVVLRESLNLLADQAALALPEKNPGVIWPELAQFDCAACHHELSKPTWRPKFTLVGEPGMPRAPRWPTELAGLILDELGGEASGKPRQPIAAIHRSLNTQPFGRPEEIAPAARQAVTWLDQRIPGLAAKKYDRTAALHLLHRLGSLSPEEILDYDSARQRAWALQIIYQELAQAPGAKPANDTAIRHLLATLAQDLSLKLPSGRKQSITEQLPSALKKREDYGPAEFRKRLGEVTKLLPDK